KPWRIRSCWQMQPAMTMATRKAIRTTTLKYRPRWSLRRTARDPSRYATQNANRNDLDAVRTTERTARLVCVAHLDLAVTHVRTSSQASRAARTRLASGDRKVDVGR